ncbi:hypothetical protein ACFQJC_11720 [Haloferax namakaokahaiae]|uniref:DUF7260 domain-containing protein n=1 Tax=Haloferax namakaokahaiae TaxID=1748331 RepID=A0ABD5ZG20_9EURY
MALTFERLETAHRALRTERRRCVDEREAFRSFHADLANQQVAAPQTTPPLVNARQQTTSSLQRVRRSYERTVMSVPHYESEYGDTFETSLREEFGPDVASVFCSSQSLSKPLHQRMVSAATASYVERVEFIEIVDAESSSLENVREEAAEIHARLRELDEVPLPDRGFEALCALYESVGDLQERLDRLVSRRQTTIMAHRRALSPLHADVTLFFYDDLDVRYPALSTLADLGEVIDTARKRIERHIAATP